MTSLRRTLAACTLVLAAPALAPAQEVFRDISSQRLENILQGMNIQYKKGDAGKGTTYYDYNSKGVALRLWNFNGKDLMIDAFFPKVEWETINKWNSTAKFSRARLDKNNKTGQESAVLESNLDLLGGVTEDTIRHFIRSFDQELTAWNPVSEEEIFKKATPDRIEKVLNAMNIKYEKKQQGDVVSYDFNKNNFDLRLISFGGSDLMIDCIWRGAQPLAKLNQWNLKRHYVRAVLYDNKGNPYVALESNLDCVAGTSESIIRYFISTFETEASAFDGHLKAK